jgi:hypothetical protein
VVAVVAIAVVGRMIVVSRTVSASRVVVTQGGTDIVAVSVVERVVAVEVVMVVVGCHPVVVVPASDAIVPIVVMVRVMISPSPTIGVTVVIPAVTIVVWTVGIAGPPPVVTHINA